MASSASWRLVRQGEPAPFEVSGDTIVGRSKKADLCIEEGFVSRRHARLWIESGTLMVEDLGSANGTFVNGSKVRGATRLAPGDCVTFDAFEYHVEALAPRIEGDPNATGLDAPEEDDATPAPAAFAFPPAHAPAAAPEAARYEAPAAVNKEAAPAPERAFPKLDEASAPRAFAADADLSESAPADENDITGPGLFELDVPQSEEPPPPRSAAEASDILPSLDDPDFDLTGVDLGGEDVFPGAERMPPPEGEPNLDFEHGSTRAIGADAHASQEQLSATVAMGSGENAAVVSPTVAMPSAEMPAQPPGDVRDPLAPALLGIVGPMEGHLIQLEPGRILVGRSPDCDIFIEHPAISRQHLEMILSGGRCRIRQIEGATGTLLNGNPVTEAELLPGDVLTFGNAEFVYDSVQSLTQNADGLPPWVWMLIGFAGAGAILTGLFMFVL